MFSAAFVALALTAALATNRAERVDLKSPFAFGGGGLRKVAPVGKATCAHAPDVIRDIKTVSKFGTRRRDHDSSIIDPEASAQYVADIKALDEFTRTIAKLADRSVQNPATAGESANCAMLWMDEWARGGGLLGDTNSTGQSVRKWELATLAVAYLKIDRTSVRTPRAERVAQWLGRIAQKVRNDYSQDLSLDSRSNNHLNWAAWAVMAAAIAADDEELFAWSVDRFHYAVRQIDTDGTLPLELKRRQLALSYHNFALAPLIMLREGAYANMVAFHPSEEERLRRLIDTVFAGLEGWTETITAKSAHPQERSQISKTHLAWLEPYYARTRDPRALKWLQRYRPMTSARLGGDLTALYGSTPARAAAP